MVCSNCGASIADKAIVCYRCGTATSIPLPAARPGKRGGRRPILLPVLVLIIGLVCGWFATVGVRTDDVAGGYNLGGMIGAAVLLLLAALLFVRRRR